MDPSTPTKSEKVMWMYSSSEEDDSQPHSLKSPPALSFHGNDLPSPNGSDGYNGDAEGTRRMRAYVKKKKDIPGEKMKKKVQKDLKRKRELEEMVEGRTDSIDSLEENESAENQEHLDQNPPSRAIGDRAEQYQVTRDGVAVIVDHRRSYAVNERPIPPSPVDDANLNLNSPVAASVIDHLLLEQLMKGPQDDSSIPDGGISEGRNGYETARIASETGEYDIARDSASSREAIEYTPTSAPIAIPQPVHIPWRIRRSNMAFDDVEPVRARFGPGKAMSRTNRISPEQTSRVDASSFGHRLEPRPTPRIMTEGFKATKTLYERLADISWKRKRT
ncbi:hypothetical protein EAE96_008175 [Botrytis aclada]|nr:hypothetical protein EAE96_008175 [Botrytis aclada]